MYIYTESTLTVVHSVSRSVGWSVSKSVSLFFTFLLFKQDTQQVSKRDKELRKLLNSVYAYKRTNITIEAINDFQILCCIHVQSFLLHAIKTNNYIVPFIRF